MEGTKINVTVRQDKIWVLEKLLLRVFNPAITQSKDALTYLIWEHGLKWVRIWCELMVNIPNVEIRRQSLISRDFRLQW